MSDIKLLANKIFSISNHAVGLNISRALKEVECLLEQAYQQQADEIQSLREQVEKGEEAFKLQWFMYKDLEQEAIKLKDQLSKYREVVEAVIEELKDDPTLGYHKYAIEALSQLKDEDNGAVW